jgi:Predicted ATPase (AAA+ superfamily)
MYQRLLSQIPEKSFFLFGPRGTGKTTWVKEKFKNALYFDLLKAETYNLLLANPSRLEDFIPKNFQGWIIIDEIQKIPKLLDEVHRLIEERHLKFVLTGSSARKIRRYGINLLGGRALVLNMHPLTAIELGKDFKIGDYLKFGGLPAVYSTTQKSEHLQSYIQTYLQQEVAFEGLTRNLAAFSRFLEVASFSQGSILNVSEVAREAYVNRKVVEDYFSILEDLLIGVRLPVFSKKAKRRLIKHSKFYFFDVGVYQALRPKGPLDDVSSLTGIALESLFFQNLRAIIDYFGFGDKIFYYRTANGVEVDFVVYGEGGIKAFEVKAKKDIFSKDLKSLKTFLDDYPMAKGYLFYGGKMRMNKEGIEIIPIEEGLLKLPKILK